MSEYQVLARKYRPQSFAEVVGQEPIVKTLKNAIKRSRIAHAYLFCGMRGTGKTTLARVFAKALNCLNPTENLEPCNQCSFCKEITSGNSLDVLEIDGASHRGIDDIRQINETVGYASASGKYKIYIIDEVHMLTKEAFNALLKTLEEPPAKVKFLFATTEPHKLPTTILSRCQRFNLSRIPIQQIMGKLKQIVDDLGASITEEALRLIANRSEGGLRDAESLLDQMLAFHEGHVDAESVASVLGIMTRDVLFLIDEAAKAGNYNAAFQIADRVVSQGKDIPSFINSLTEHFRNLILLKVPGADPALLLLTEAEHAKYVQSAKYYSKEQCLLILDFLIEVQSQRFTGSERIMLESILLRIIRSHSRIPVELLVRRLSELESAIAGEGAPPPPSAPPSTIPHPTVELPASRPMPPPTPELYASITIDPTPSKADLGVRAKKQQKPLEAPAPAPIELGARLTPEAKHVSVQQQSKYETLLQFATVELEGIINKKNFKGV